MQKYKNILVTGSSAVLGTAIRKISPRYKSRNFIFLNSKDCDLTNYKATLKTFGEHPTEKKNITAHDGKFGPYVKCGKINASLLGDQTIDSLNLEEAIKLIDERKQKIGLKKKKK